MLHAMKTGISSGRLGFWLKCACTFASLFPLTTKGTELSAPITLGVYVTLRGVVSYQRELNAILILDFAFFVIVKKWRS